MKIRFSLKKAGFIGLALLLLIVVFISGTMSGSARAKVTLGEEKLSYEELKARSEETESDLEMTKIQLDEQKDELAEVHDNLTAVETELADLESNLEGKQEEFNYVSTLIGRTEEIEAEVAKLEKEYGEKAKELDGQIAKKQTEAEELDQAIASKEDELAVVSGLILEKKGEPITLPAGTFIVGFDLPAGRYSASVVSGSDNFVVYGYDGYLEVNTILGDTEYSVPEHVFFADEGDIIENGAPTEFTPVE